MTDKGPPDFYMDGCTMFPDTFGKVSHKEVCDRHDRDYWNDRTILGKLKADLMWAIRLTRVHLTAGNFLWLPVIIPASLVGFVGLSIFGLYFWQRRHEYDDATQND